MPKSIETAVQPPDKPELLAPAGSIDGFYAVLAQGADAVYVGTPLFNARLRARNFSVDELARMMAYAHSQGRRVYVTLNTVVREAELRALVDTLDELRRLGPDALIIQDMGVYDLAKRLAPEISLHASTQMTIHNLDGALQAQRMGLTRAILARELTLEEIAFIRRGSEIELETFVHGAMCYSISGQCNFSSYIHGKSANRGRCLQPCRRLYDVGKKRLPLFAPLDLGTAPILSQLMAAGIRCFKIEGRLKPAETMAQIVAAYRLLIDAHPAITKEVVAEARHRLKLAIGRRQSTGFYRSASPKDSMVEEGTTQAGRYLGKIQRVKGSSFEICTHEVVKVGDRLNVQKNIHRPPQGFRIKRMFTNNMPIKRSRPNQVISIDAPVEVHTGWAVVKQIDADAQAQEGQNKKGNTKGWPKAKERSKAVLAADLCFDWNGAVTLQAELRGTPLSIEAWPSHETQTPLHEATKVLEAAPKDAPVRLAVGKTADFPDGVPMTQRELETLRDELLAAVQSRFEADRASVLEELRAPLPRATSVADPAHDDPFVRLSSLREALVAAKQQRIRPIIPISEAALPEFAEAFQKRRLHETLICEFPTFAFGAGKQRKALVSAVNSAVQAGVRRFMVSNLGHFALLQPHRQRDLEVIAGEALHCMNSAAFETLSGLGANLVVYAQEGDAKSLLGLLKRVDPRSLVVQVYGKVPLFRSRQPHPSGVKEATCVVGSNERLEILQRDGLTHVLPKRDFSLRHCIEDLRAAGLRHFLYDLSHVAATTKRVRAALAETDALNERSESAMNFERGLT